MFYDTMILLPKIDGINPNYDYIKKFIRIQEKMAIKDAVLLKDGIAKGTL